MGKNVSKNIFTKHLKKETFKKNICISNLMTTNRNLLKNLISKGITDPLDKLFIK